MAVLIWMVGGALGLFLAGSGIADGDLLLIFGALGVLAVTFLWGGYEKQRRDARLGERPAKDRFYSFP